ncbi:hypothetical protein NQ314_009474 [Rhamnusium bicolor]|uniref:Uncharacterized protein n=1 Tax=Rhamnusium bicolor TaxID=1586634 RepID=A0AAV8Y0M8_9CUCU|nr:hypothetical protein NQ314_009474 [Rhamnusium bicolor]
MPHTLFLLFQTWRLAGQRITEFCKGFPTYLIKDIANEDQNYDAYMNDLPIADNVLNRRRKRSTRHYFKGRVRGQTQSQYLNIGTYISGGNNGMGQAQSQTLHFGCEDCYGPGYGEPSGYDHEQTIGYGQGRLGQKFPEPIIQARPDEVRRPHTGTQYEVPERGGPGHIGEEYGQFGQRPGQNGEKPLQAGIAGQIGGGSGGVGDIGRGSEQNGGRPGQSGSAGQINGGLGGVGDIDRGTGKYGGNGHINGGQYGGDISGGQIGGTSQTGGRNGHVGGSAEAGGDLGQPIRGNGQIGRDHDQISGGYVRGPAETSGDLGQPIGGNGQIGRGNGRNGGGYGQNGGGPGLINAGTGTPSGVNGLTGGGLGQPGGIRGQNGGGLGHIGGGPIQTGGGPGQYGQGTSQIAKIPDHLGGISGPNGELGSGGQPITSHGPIGPGQVGGPSPGGVLQGTGLTEFGQAGRPGQNGDFGVSGITGSPGQNGGAVRPTAGGVGKMGQVIDLGESITRPTQHGGLFGGQLAGDYQSNLGHSGRFHGKFSGQYEAVGTPYTGYRKPVIAAGQPGYTGQAEVGLQPTHHLEGYGLAGKPSVTGIQPGFGGAQTSYPSGYDSQSKVQRPITGGSGSAIYPSGYESTNGYQPRPNYGALRPSQGPNGHVGVGLEYAGLPGSSYQPVGQAYGPQQVTEQYGVQGIPGQYQNGLHGVQTFPSGPGQTGFQPSPTGNGVHIGIGNGGMQLGYGNQPDAGTVLKPGVQGGSGFQPGIGVSGIPVSPESQVPGHGRLPEYTGQNGVGQGLGGYEVQPGIGGTGQYVPGVPNYGTGSQPGQTGYIDQQGVGRIGQYGTTNANHYPGTGVEGVPIQYTDRRYPGTIEQGTGSRITESAQEFDDSDSQVQTSVQQTGNGTHAQAQAQGTYNGGTAQSQVSGIYSGSGSFSASAGSDDGKRGAQTQVAGGKDGAQSSAQGKGGLGQSQAQVILSSETGDTLSSAQTGGFSHDTQSQVQASEKGGMADAQANGAGSTSSQAQIGFTPYDEHEEDNQTIPFRGGGTAGAQSGSYSGITQAQIQGKFRYGIKYTGAAQAGSGGIINGRNQTIKPGPFKPIDLTLFAGQNEKSQSHVQDQVSTIQTNQKLKDSTLSPIQESTELNSNEEENEEEYEEEDDYDRETETPATRSIITQSSENQRQHIIIDPLEDLDATVHQSRGVFPSAGTILQPGQTIPGSPGYKIPLGFRGTVKSISNGRNTYAIGKNSQAQSVTLSPGSGRIIYKRPVYAVSSNTHFRNGQYGYGSGYTYQPAYQPVQYLLKNGKVLPNFVSVSKSETGSKNLYTGKKTPSIYYTQSSTCGIFTNHCVFNAGKKTCFPKIKTNADGTIMGC